MKHRPLRLEQLEDRRLLHADPNLDHRTTAADALTVINHLAGAAEYHRNLDCNSDGMVTAADALHVINRIALDRQRPYFAVTLGSLDTVGVSRTDTLWAIKEAFAEFEEVANIDWRIVPSGGRWQIASRELYLGNRVHARGLYQPGRIWFHNGTVSDRPDLGYRWDPWYSNPQNLKRVIQHELMHALGYSHTADRSCVANINAGADKFCPAELASLVRIYGASKLP